MIRTRVHIQLLRIVGDRAVVLDLITRTDRNRWCSVVVSKWLLAFFGLPAISFRFSAL